jgi:hypothetical protein
VAPLASLGHETVKRTSVLAALIIVFANSHASNATDASSWQRLKKLGQVADVGAEYEKAANYYAQALKLIPTKEESQIADVEALLGTDYVRMFKFAVAEPLAERMLEVIPKLKASHRLDPEVLVNVKYFAEAYHGSSAGRLPMDQRKRNFNVFEIKYLDLADLVAPNEEEKDGRRFDSARGYIYYNQPINAELALRRMLVYIKPSSQYYVPIRLAQGAVQWKMGKPELLEKLKHDYAKKFGEVDLLRQVAKAHLWAANYDEADKALEQGLAILAKKKPPNVEKELELQRPYLLSLEERNLWSKSEIHARRIVELIEHSKGKKSDDYNKAVNKLVFCLTKNNKLAEAKAFKSKIPNNFDWLIDDGKK